jgi:hypothetical protein
VDVGYYLYNRVDGTTTIIAQPGDPMPGGGHFVSPIRYQVGNVDLNDRGDVTFGAVLDTDTNGDGQPDTGVYQWSNGTLTLIARSGTAIPGAGTIGQMGPPEEGNWGSGAMSNEKGQVFLQATLTDGTGVLLVATPRGKAPDVPLYAQSRLQLAPQVDSKSIAVLDQAIMDFGELQPTAKRKH